MHSSFVGPLGINLILLTVLTPFPQGGPPDFPFAPSYEVHISPSTKGCPNCTPGSTGPSSHGPSWSLSQGFDLQTMLAAVYKINRSRVDIPQSLDDGKFYDFGLVLPKDETEETMNHLIAEAIKKQFQLTITFETRPMDVYVLTASHGQSPSLKPSPENFGVGGGSLSVVAPEGDQGRGRVSLQQPGASITGISVATMTMDNLCRLLETSLDRLVVDESQLKGSYSFAIRDNAIHTTDEFLQRLRDQIGLVLAPDQRDVTMLVVRPVTATP